MSGTSCWVTVDEVERFSEEARQQDPRARPYGPLPAESRHHFNRHIAHGRLELFLQGGDAQTYQAWQTAPTDGWSAV